jgi:hypothetical protein
MAQFGDQIFQVQGDDRLVLDDQHLAGQLGVDGLLGPQDGGFDLFRALPDDESGFFQAEGLHRGQKQGRPLGCGEGFQPAFRGFAAGNLGSLVKMLGTRLPDGVEQTIKAHAGGDPLHKALISRQKCRQGGTDMGIPAGLRSGQGPGIAAQIGKMRRKGLR